MAKHLMNFFLLLISSVAVGQQVGLGTTTPHASAALDITSTNGGFLPPRMTLAQRNAITSPAVGLTIYNTTSNCLETWDGQSWFGPCAILINSYPTGMVFCDGIVTKIVPVLNPVTGKIWMDRNLGATRAATSSADADAYGDLYQWGRRADGHQCRNSTTTTTLSSSDQPSNGSFIVTSSYVEKDWRSLPNNNLWQGVNGINNPCPVGYRLPTDIELSEERLSWISNNIAGAFASPLKLPIAGIRNVDGGIFNAGVFGRYWSSTPQNRNSRGLTVNTNSTNFTDWRGYGLSVRCIKD